MKSKDVTGISRQAWELVEHIKSQTLQNLTVAQRSGEIQIGTDQLPRLIRLVQTSIEQGYHGALHEFETQISVQFETESKKK